MPVEKDPKLGLYVDALKAWLPTVRERFTAWGQACREEPSLIWQTPAVRYTTYVVGGLLASWLLVSVVNMFAPQNATAPARTADFHVICTNTGCGHQFVVNRKFGFDKFPVVCPRCQKATGERAIRCSGGPRDGAWVRATETPDGRLVGADCDAPASTDPR